MATKTCPICRGSRKDFMQPSQPCPNCGGRGWVNIEDSNSSNSPRGKLTTKDVISYLILMAVVIGFVIYIFSR